MKKEIIECDLCGAEIAKKSEFYYQLKRKQLVDLLCSNFEGPGNLDICRHCLKNLIEPLGKWPEPVEPTAIPVYDGGGDPHF